MGVTHDTVAVPTPTAAGSSPTWTCYVVGTGGLTGTAGVDYWQLTTGLDVEQVVSELNQLGTATFSISTTDSNIAQLRLIEREIQLYRNGDLVFWGVPITADVLPDGNLTVQCRDVLWHLTGRYLGGITPTNYLANSSFESGGSGTLSSWSQIDEDSAGATFQALAQYPVLGDYAAQINCSSSNEQVYLRQEITFDTGAGGTPLVLLAHSVLETFSGPGFESRGVLVGYRLQSDSASYPLHWTTTTISKGSPLYERQRHVASLYLPPNETVIVTVRLYGVNGQIHWDAVKLLKAEALVQRTTSITPGGWDASTIAKNLVRYAQGRSIVFLTWSHGKTDLNIGVDGDSAGYNLERDYFFVTKQQIYSGSPGGPGCLDEFPARSTPIDFALRITPTTRTFVTFPGGQGSSTGKTVKWSGAGRNVSKYRVSHDGTGIANQVTVVGRGSAQKPTVRKPHDGDIPDYRGKEDLTTLAGLTREAVVRYDGPIDVLDEVAAAELARRKDQVNHVEAEVFDVRDSSGAVTDQYVAYFDTGDTLTVTIDTGWQSVDSTMRVVKVVHDARADTDTLTLEPSTIPEAVRQYDVSGELDRLRLVTERLDQRLELPVPAELDVVSWSISSLSAGAVTSTWRSVNQRRLISVYVTLDVATSGSTVFSFYKNGVVADTLTVGSGTSGSKGLQVELDQDDLFYVEATTVGTGPTAASGEFWAEPF